MECKSKLGILIFSLWAVAANASERIVVTTLPEGPTGEIDVLTEESFFIDGSASSARLFTFSNGTRFLYFIPMVHQAEAGFYDAVAKGVAQLKANGMDLFYEFIDFDAASLEDKRRARAMLGLLPSPRFYERTVPEGLAAQDNALFLGFPGGKDLIVDLTPAELADAYEKLIGPLEISAENLTKPMEEYVTPTADIQRLSYIIIDSRNEHLANAINEAPGDVIVVYGAAHGAGTVKELHALDPNWQREE